LVSFVEKVANQLEFGFLYELINYWI